MLNLFVNSDGGLTVGGYVLCFALFAASLLCAFAFVDRHGAKASGPKQLAFCAMAVALAYVASFIKLFKLPYGGSVTLLSMLFIVQFLQEPYFLSLVQVCCDYVLAFAALGIAGCFRHRKNGLSLGYAAAVLSRGAFHALGGYLYWMDYMPDSFPQALRDFYPIIYNYSFLLTEGAITLAVIHLPAVKAALDQIRKLACGDGKFTETA